MATGMGSSLQRFQRVWLDSSISALRDEVLSQQQNCPQQIPLCDGVLLDFDSSGCYLDYEILQDVFLPDGVTVEIKLDDKWYSAEMIQRLGIRITLLVRDYIPENGIPEHAELKANPWFLLEELAARLEELRDGARPAYLASALLERMYEQKPLAGTLSVDVQHHTDVFASSSGKGYGPELLKVANKWQEMAVGGCDSNPLWFVWGPPGTGKTRTLGQLVAHLSQSGGSILITSHANVAVDAAVLAIAQIFGWSPNTVTAASKPRLIRVGPPALEEVKRLKLSTRDWVLRLHPELRAQVDGVEKLLERIRELRKEKHNKSALKDLLRKALESKRQVDNLIKRYESEVLEEEADIIACTLSKLAVTPALYGMRFETVLVDEASMIYPPQILFAASLGELRLSIFGDFRQLPPVVVSESHESRNYLGRDIFEWTGIVQAVERGEEPADMTMLRVQYRMHPEIRNMVSRFAYGGHLQDSPDILNRVEGTTRLPPEPGSSIVIYNVAPLQAECWHDADGRSRLNLISAFCALSLLPEFLAARKRVALVTPYRAQASLLTSLIRDFGFENVVVGTIHRLQGSESECVILDLVDAPPCQVPGQLFQEQIGKRLLTVATSRAQGKLIILLHSKMLTHCELVRTLLKEYRPIPFPKVPKRLEGKSASLRLWLPFEESQEFTAQTLAKYLPSSQQTSNWRIEVIKASGGDGNADRHPSVSKAVTLIPQKNDYEGLSYDDVVTLIGQRSVSRIVALTSRQTPSDVDLNSGLSACPKCLTVLNLEPCREGRWGRGWLISRCLNCGYTRQATGDDINRWAEAFKILCPKCRAPMRARLSDRGWFLGCTKYPNCKGTRDLTELLGD